ncbi:MAG: GNAT family N-acetyltransferase [Saprospiraceae bacterium]|nr:GNAT family N-acetyltransferase [Saprospiraceae bacterium]
MTEASTETIWIDDRLGYQIKDADVKRIPNSGPMIIIVNRMIPGLDERLLIQLFASRFSHFKILTDHPLKDEGDLSNYFFKKGGFNLNLLQNPIGFFEAFINILEAESGDEPWVLAVVVDFSKNTLDSLSKTPYLKRLFKSLKKAAFPILPVRLDMLDKKGPLLELISQRKHEPHAFLVRVGKLIGVEEQEKAGASYWKYLRSKLFALGTGLEVKRIFQLSFLKNETTPDPLAEPIDQALIEKDIQNLTFDNLVTSKGEFDVFVAESHQIPNVLQEIGRLREMTFRDVGEGTGKCKDLDEFDIYYLQLIIWDRDASQIAGGYRLGKGDQIFSSYGVEGFYINSLFKIEEGFFPILRESIELGRSYIIPDYQRKRLPLFLLWRGILFFLLKNPHYKYLYGPLSISKYYSEVSKSLIVEFVKRYYFDHELARYLKPRKPFKVKTKKVDIEVLLENLPPELGALDNFIEDIEPEHFRIPVLLKQYAKQNAKFISFNVDPNFSDVLDGFMILDLKHLPLSTIETLKEEQS